MIYPIDLLFYLNFKKQKCLFSTSQRGLDRHLNNCTRNTVVTSGVVRGGGGTRPPLGERRGAATPLAPVGNTTKLLKSGLKTRLERLKNWKFSYPEGDTPSPGPEILRPAPPPWKTLWLRPCLWLSFLPLHNFYPNGSTYCILMFDHLFNLKAPSLCAFAVSNFPCWQKRRDHPLFAPL